MKDGGQAFPNAQSIDAEGRIIHCAEFGMTLRDYFAGQALMSYLAGRNSDSRDSQHESVADACYRYADAMLAAREPKPEGGGR